MKIWDNKIPYNPNTKEVSLSSHIRYEARKSYIWVDNFNFKACIKYRTELGNSGMMFTVENLIESPYEISQIRFFMCNIKDVIMNMVHGEICGEFTFCKRGTEFGCKLIQTLGHR